MASNLHDAMTDVCAMPSAAYAVTPWNSSALTGVQLSGISASIPFSATAVVGVSVPRDAGTVQGPPRVPR